MTSPVPSHLIAHRRQTGCTSCTLIWANIAADTRVLLQFSFIRHSVICDLYFPLSTRSIRNNAGAAVDGLVNARGRTWINREIRRAQGKQQAVLLTD